MVSDTYESNRVLPVARCETHSCQTPWESVKHNIFQPLNSDLALCVSGQTPFHEHTNYIWLIEDPEDWTATCSRVARTDEWMTLLELDRRFIGIVGEYSNHVL